VTTSQINSDLTSNSARLTEIRVDNAAASTFDVTMVANSGPYASAWWWYVGQSTSSLNTTLSDNHSRLISLEPYVVGGTVEYAAIEVPNTGSQARSWWWYVGQSSSGISSTVTANNARLISLRPVSVGGSTTYSVIEISNTGSDYADGGWWWSINESAAQVNAQINIDSVRLVSLAADPAGGFDAVYIASEGEYWSWYYGVSASTLVTDVANDGDRLIDITSYSLGGQTVYAGVGLDDTNSLQSPINNASAKVSAYANSNGWGGGLSGVYLAPAGTPTKPTVAYNSGYRYEPASSIKALYLLYSLLQVQLGNDALTSSFTYYVDPNDPTNAGVCPQAAWETPANAQTTTLGAALQLMMYNSDNRATRAMEERYGIANVQNLARIIGLPNSTLAQPFIGCGFQGSVRNQLTAADIADLYAKVATGKVLSSSFTKTFFADELGGTPASTDYLTTVISQEAAKLGKTSIAASFTSETVNHWKAGSYSFCMASDCSAYKADFATGGVLVLPFKNSGGKITLKSYAYSDFVNDLYVPCTPGSGCSAETAAYAMINQVADEAARGPIDSALKTW
jgi:hypothetical protein